jgi:hypothetical protein
MIAVQPDGRPLFAVDRCLGKTTCAALRERGWNLILITEVFPDDAQDVSDEEWMTWAAGEGSVDAALTKDSSMRRASWYQSSTIPVFSLGNQQTKTAEMVELFDRHRAQIDRIAFRKPGRQFWVIRRNGELSRTR